MSNFDGTTSKRRPCFQSRSKYATSKKKWGKLGTFWTVCTTYMQDEWKYWWGTIRKSLLKGNPLFCYADYISLTFILFSSSVQIWPRNAELVTRALWIVISPPPPLPLFSCSRRLTPNFLYIFLAVYLHFYIHRDNSFRTRDTICILHQTVETLALARSRYCYENVGNSKNDVGAADTKKSHRRMYTKLE